MPELPPLFDDNSPLRRTTPLSGMAGGQDVRLRGLQRRRRQRVGVASAGVAAAAAAVFAVTTLGGDPVVSTEPAPPAATSTTRAPQTPAASTTPATPRTPAGAGSPSSSSGVASGPVREAAWLTDAELSDSIGIVDAVEGEPFDSCVLDAPRRSWKTQDPALDGQFTESIARFSSPAAARQAVAAGYTSRKSAWATGGDCAYTATRTDWLDKDLVSMPGVDAGRLVSFRETPSDGAVRSEVSLIRDVTVAVAAMGSYAVEITYTAKPYELKSRHTNDDTLLASAFRKVRTVQGLS